MFEFKVKKTYCNCFVCVFYGKYKENVIKTYEFESEKVAKITHSLFRFMNYFRSKQHHGGDDPFKSRFLISILPIEETKQVVEPVTYRG